jgi:ribose-phosphate pyrophosphokinase
VSAIKTAGEKRLVIVSGRAHPELAEQIAEELETTLVHTDARTFANGELYIRYDESVRGSDAFVIQSHSAPINEWLMEQLIMVDAMKRASAKRITVVAPFYPYARQDKKGRGREPISARLVADLFKAAGADRIMSVDLHAAQIQGFFDGPVDHLFAMPVLLEHMRQVLDSKTLTVVSPDMGRVRVADIWSDKLGAPLAIIHKRRDPKVHNQVTVHEIVGDVAGRVCLLVDDLIDTGRTIVSAAEALKKNGATAAETMVPGHADPEQPAHRLGRGHGLAPHPGGQALGQAHGAAHRAAARPRDPRGLRRRIRHEHVRRRGLGPPARPASGGPPRIRSASSARRPRARRAPRG